MIFRRAVLASALLLLGVGVAPSNSAVAESGSVLTAGAHIYELTESAKFILRGRRPSRARRRVRTHLRRRSASSPWTPTVTPSGSAW